MKRCLVVLSVLLAAPLGLSAQQGEIIEQILVKVNGDIISKSELEQRQIAALRQRDPNFRPTNDTELQRALGEVTPQVIVDSVHELLLVQRGRELGYALGTDQFLSIVENIRKENNLDSDEQFQAALKQEGLTMDDLRRQLERQMLVTRVQQLEVMGKISVTDEEIRQLYDANRNAFTTPAQFMLREILVAVPQTERGINAAADDAAREKADEIRQRIDAGEPFARLASELSDSPSKANGGLIGPISQADLSPELAQELEGLKPEQLTRTLRTPRGYQIIKLESVTPAQVRGLEEARADIADQVAETKRLGQLRRYLDQLREQAIIDWKNDEIKKAFDVGLSQFDALTAAK